MRVRVMQNNIFLDIVRDARDQRHADGVRRGLLPRWRTKAIDAQENPYVTIDTSQFYEVQDYLSATKHAYTPFMVLFSGPIFDTYSEEEQQILVDCLRDRPGRAAVREPRVVGPVARAGAGGRHGLQTRSPPRRCSASARAVASVYDRSAESIGQDVIDAMMAELATIRGELKPRFRPRPPRGAGPPCPLSRSLPATFPSQNPAMTRLSRDPRSAYS